MGVFNENGHKTGIYGNIWKAALGKHSWKASVYKTDA